MRRLLLPALLLAGLAAGLAAAQTSGSRADADALTLAKRQAEEATARSRSLERQADKATGDAARARAEASAIAARIEAAEAGITAAEARIRLIENLRAEQRARLAERQQPVVRLTAALQTMARRPPALALVQPGSLDDVVHVRALLASTLPIIRERTAALRAEVEAGNRLRRQEARAVAALTRGQRDLRKRRLEFARLEAKQNARSQSLIDSALGESDRALALGEDALDLTKQMATRQYQSRLRRNLAALPGPALRPNSPAGNPRTRTEAPFILPVAGRLVTGMGEISDAGVHARGLTFETAANAEIVAPASGRVAYSGPFRGYGEIVIIAHKGGWSSTLANLGRRDVRVGQQVAKGQPIGRAPRRKPLVTVELRRHGRPFPITPLLSLG